MNNATKKNLSKNTSVEIASEKFGELKFKIGSETSILSDWKKITEIREFLNTFIKYTEYWNQYIYYYKNYSKNKIKKFLDEQELKTLDSYSIGENFALFTDSKTDMNIADNDDAGAVIKELYEQAFGKNHTLEFDPEMSFCYVYTKDRKEAENFLWWSYTDIIKPILDEIQH